MITFLSIILNIITFSLVSKCQKKEKKDSYLVVTDGSSSNIYILHTDKPEWLIQKQAIIKGLIGEMIDFEKNNVIISDSNGFKYCVRVNETDSFALNDRLLVLYSTTGEEPLVSPIDFTLQYCYFRLNPKYIIQNPLL